jgi:[acyl-carrier-protein] S-malonyltransferase
MEMSRLDHVSTVMVLCWLMKSCFIFPGQGAQYPGMARDLWENSAGVKELFQRASDGLGLDMKALLFDSTQEELKATDRTQVAMTLASLSAAQVLGERGVKPQACAGFSLGEYAALCCAGVISPEDVFSIVKLRGVIMEKAARALDAAGGAEAGTPGMAAVLGLPAEKVMDVLEGLADFPVFLSNYNGPTQSVISGTAEGLARAEAGLKAAGAKRIVRLQVSGPFHSPLMAEARSELDAALAPFAFHDPAVPVYSNVTGERIATGAEARELCGRQLVSPVRWVAEEERLIGDGCDRFYEAGPGTVLTGLLRGLRPDVRCSPSGTHEAIAKALEEAP